MPAADYWEVKAFAARNVKTFLEIIPAITRGHPTGFNGDSPGFTILIRPPKVRRFRMNDVPIENLTLETFAPRVQTPFAVLSSAGTPVSELKLVAAQGAPSLPVPGGKAVQESFSLLFLGPADSLLPQGTISLEHQQIGRFLLFLVPVNRSAAGIEYQAVFNRIKPA